MGAVKLCFKSATGTHLVKGNVKNLRMYAESTLVFLDDDATRACGERLLEAKFLFEARLYSSYSKLTPAGQGGFFCDLRHEAVTKSSSYQQKS